MSDEARGGVVSLKMRLMYVGGMLSMSEGEDV